MEFRSGEFAIGLFIGVVIVIFVRTLREFMGMEIVMDTATLLLLSAVASAVAAIASVAVSLIVAKQGRTRDRRLAKVWLYEDLARIVVEIEGLQRNLRFFSQQSGHAVAEALAQSKWDNLHNEARSLQVVLEGLIAQCTEVASRITVGSKLVDLDRDRLAVAGIRLQYGDVKTRAELCLRFLN